jgi:hypothetical protein
MKTLTFNRKSWHYWVASFGNEYRCNRVNNICDYTRKFMGGLFLLILAFTTFCGGVYVLADFFAWMVACIVNMVLIIPNMATEFIIILIALSVSFIAIVYVIDTVRNHEDTFIYNAYRSYTDKYCIRVNFK